MTTIKKYFFLEKTLPRLLIAVCGLIGLYMCAPGFRPKHIRDSAVGLFNERGLAIVVGFVAMGLLIPAASRLKQKGFTQTVSGAFVACLGVFYSVDLVIEVILKSHTFSQWLMRGLYLALAIWGFSDKKHIQALKTHFVNHTRTLWTGLGHWGWKALFVCMLFFFILQDLHLYLIRGVPFIPTGDEVAWWHTMGKQILHEGMYETMKIRGYSLGVQWLIAFIPRITGVYHDEWLAVFPIVVMASYLTLIFELATTTLGFLASFTLVFFVFLINRDLLYQYGATLYAEALCTWLVAVFVAEIYKFWNHRKSILKNQFNAALIGFALMCGFCASIKPPLSTLTQMLTPFFIFYVLYHSKKSREKLGRPLLLCVLALGPFLFWKYTIKSLGTFQEYNVTLAWLAEKGIDLSVPWGMILGLGIVGSCQFAYTLAMILALVLVASQRQYFLLKLMVGLTILYWGFVFGVYATVWQNWEKNSAGRYLSHSAIALLLLVPLAFPSKKNDAWKVH